MLVPFIPCFLPFIPLRVEKVSDPDRITHGIVMENVNYRLWFILFALSSPFSVLSCGEAIGDALGFKPNKAPEIGAVTAVRTDGMVQDEHDLLSDTSFLITAEAADPEGKQLSWRFDSNCGSFSPPEDTAAGCRVYFITDMPEGNTAVTVTLYATDEKDAVSEKTITIGYGKPKPQISITKNALTVAGAGAESFSVHADCIGTFQVYLDNSILVPGDAHYDETKSYCIFGFDPSAADPSVSVYGYSGSAEGFKLRMPPEPGAYNVWVVFRDRIEQEDAELCTVTVQ